MYNVYIIASWQFRPLPNNKQDMKTKILFNILYHIIYNTDLNISNK